MTSGDVAISSNFRRLQYGEFEIGGTVTPGFLLGPSGTVRALPVVMAVPRHRDLIAWQLADELKSAVFLLLEGSPPATADLRFASQLREAARGPAKHIAEGFARFSPRGFMLYLDYALSSIVETEEHLHDGIALGYFTATACATAFRFARRCTSASSRLKHSQRRFKPWPRRGGGTSPEG